MNGLFSRGACAALLACVLLTTRAEAQTSLELFAGGTPYLDTPANTVPVTPNALALAPDGTLYLADDVSGKVLSFDPATSTITSVPNLPGVPEFRFSQPRALGYSSPGVLNFADAFEHWQLNLDEGYLQYFGQYGGGIVSAAFGPDDSLYFSRYSEHEVLERTTSGSVSTFAGSTLPGFSGDGTSSASFNEPRGVVFDAAGNAYIADSGNHRVRRRAADTGIFTTVAGTGATNYNGNNLLATQTNLSTPTALAIDTAGNLYIYEAGGYRIRKLNAATGRITNFAGNGAYGGNPGNGGLAVNASLTEVADMKIGSNGTLYISETSSYRVRKVDASGIISQVIGNGTASFCGEGTPARLACLSDPHGATVDDAGNVYVSDRGNRRIRKISGTTGLITTIAGGDVYTSDGDGGPALAARFLNGTSGIAVDAARNVYVLDGMRVRRIDAATGIISTIAGSTSWGFAGDGGPAVAARFDGASRLALDRSGNLFISDANNYRVRRIDAATGIITTVAGNGLSTGPLGDGGPATAASLASPESLAFDAAGNLLIADVYHYRIRKVNLTTGIITTIAGYGGPGYGGDGGPATAAGIGFRPSFAVDARGNIWVASTYSLRRIDAQTGIINPAPGVTWSLLTPEGRGLEMPNSIVLGPDNRFYISDASSVVFRVSGLPPPAGDQTPPVIEPRLTGTPGLNGWYRSNVQVSWTVTDAESPITSRSGCTTNFVTNDTAGVTFTCTANSTGGTASRSVTIRRDTIAPRLSFREPEPAGDASGWHSWDVFIPFTTSDSLSGVLSSSYGSPVAISGEGEGLTVQIVVTDYAGNSTSFTTPPVNIDRSPPVITPTVSGTLGTHGWYTSDVQVEWTVSDSVSPIRSSEGCDSNGVSADTESITIRCTAISAGGISTNAVTIKRDATAPLLEFGAPSPAANSEGWHAGDVTFPYEADDATSGVLFTSSDGSVTITGEGTGLTAQVTVTDEAGNAATFTTPAVNIARTPPVITAQINGALGSNGWYTTNVQVAWTTDGGIAPVSSSTGCDTSTVITDTAGTTFTCTATSAGGTTTESVTIKRDATPPALVFGAASPAPSASGWHSSDVSFAFTTADDTSGVASTSNSNPLVITGEGAGLTASVTVTDAAGNSASFATPPVNIDRAPVTVTPVVTGTLGNEGWYTSDVQVSWNITGNVIDSTGCGVGNVTTDIASVTFSCSVTGASGTASNSVTLKRDATPPLLTWRAPTPNANAAGWNRTNVNFPFDPPTDARSGVASVSTTSPLVVSAEGAGVTGSVTVTDRAGNVAVFTTTPRNIDKTAPTVNVRTPLHNKVYGLYATLIADYDCTDAVSGATSCSGTLANGATLNTRAMNGSYKFQVISADAAGNSVTKSNTWSVAGSFLFEGFLAPMANDPVYNLVTAGSRVPMRFRLPDRNGGYVSDVTAFQNFTVNSERCISSSVPLNDVATGSAGLSFDSATSTFTYNWDTNADWAGTCRNVVVRLIDGSRHTLYFKFQ